ncbi:hypothetical protein Tco_1428344 [Tanacetum coccineum]
MLPTAVQFDVDTGSIYIRHYEILKSVTLNILAKSDDNAFRLINALNEKTRKMKKYSIAKPGLQLSKSYGVALPTQLRSNYATSCYDVTIWSFEEVSTKRKLCHSSSLTTTPGTTRPPSKAYFSNHPTTFMVHKYVRIMEEELDIENMTLEEYLKYESKKEILPHRATNEVDIDSMTIVEYQLYMANQSPRKNRLNDHTYGFTSKFCDQSSCTPIPQPEDKELSLKEVLNNLFRIGAENLRGIKQEEVQVEECNEGNMEEIWDITIEDIERLKRLLTPTIEALPKPKPMVQPYVPLILFPNEVKFIR